MESGTLNISGIGDDGIQVELDGTASTGTKADHEDEDTGNFYMEDGTLTISGCGSYAIKADGTISYSGGKQNITGETQQNAASGISSIQADDLSGSEAIYDLNGRILSSDALNRKGIYLIKKGKKTTKIIIQ
jgi:hypothetical protein